MLHHWPERATFLGAYVKLQKYYWLLYVTLSLCMEQLGFHCMVLMETDTCVYFENLSRKLNSL